ncbi:polymorphic outer membrane protein [Thecamonas trahens ATCC 50062]|uniref:Polymorphic outer membrane protein n=1 Tax=Thecamonas trahens ATCC 50062 TaxID=461836 RepID=A0A0L0DR34_THETB|nr:polymorphic outer membrane protein [Thecamonas trahens ATCC 50062]KNC54476.1 polymorphic outer membrane protein [Thecamonas trahens ATCC 50062]|eukprot:XP_013753630.1 polymorphic outer membrane protein [Thecamonas trahens ATCC 50062]
MAGGGGCVLATRLGNGVCDDGSPFSGGDAAASPVVDLRCHACDGGDCSSCGCSAACSAHGVCIDDSRCVCAPGWAGPSCALAATSCAPGVPAALTAASGSFRVGGDIPPGAACGWLIRPASAAAHHLLRVSLADIELDRRSTVRVYAGSRAADGADARLLAAIPLVPGATSDPVVVHAPVSGASIVFFGAHYQHTAASGFTVSWAVEAASAAPPASGPALCAPKTAVAVSQVTSTGSVDLDAATSIGPGESCVWLLSGPAASVLSFELLTLQTVAGEVVVRLRDGSSPDGTILMEATGSAISGTIPPASGATARLEILAAGELSALPVVSLGFRANSGAPPGPAPPPALSTADGDHCYGVQVLTGLVGEIANPSGSATTYRPNARCAWVVTPTICAGTLQVTIDATATSLVHGGAVLRILDGPVSTDAQIVEFSGNASSLPAEALVWRGSGPSVRIEFESGPEPNVDAGFKVSWDCLGSDTNSQQYTLPRQVADDHRVVLRLAIHDSAATSEPFLASDNASWNVTSMATGKVLLSSTMLAGLSASPTDEPRGDSLLAANLPAAGDFLLGSMAATATHVANPCRLTEVPTVASLGAIGTALNISCSVVVPSAALDAFVLTVAGRIAEPTCGSVSDNAANEERLGDDPCTRNTTDNSLECCIYDTHFAEDYSALIYDVTVDETVCCTASASMYNASSPVCAGNYSVPCESTTTAALSVVYEATGLSRVIAQSAVSIAHLGYGSAVVQASPDPAATAVGTADASLVVALDLSPDDSSISASWTIDGGSSSFTAGPALCPPNSAIDGQDASFARLCNITVTSGTLYNFTLTVSPPSALRSYSLYAVSDGPYVVAEADGSGFSGSESVEFVVSNRCRGLATLTGADASRGIVTAHLPARTFNQLVAPGAAGDVLTVYDGPDERYPVLGVLDASNIVDRSNAGSAVLPALATRATASRMLVVATSSSGQATAPVLSFEYTFRDASSVCASRSQSTCACSQHVACGWCPGTGACVPVAGSACGLDAQVCTVTLNSGATVSELSAALSAAPRHATTALVDVVLPDTHAGCLSDGLMLDGVLGGPEVRIRGNGPATTTLDCSGTTGGARAFRVGGSARVTLADMTITGCSASGAGGSLWIDSGSLTLSNVVVSTSQASGCGGGVAVSGSGFASFISGSQIVSSTAAGHGGAVCISGPAASAKLQDTTLQANTAGGDGGGLYVGDEASVAGGLEDLTVSNNTAGGSGGGIALHGVSGALARSTLNGNSAGVDGGDLAVDGSGSVSMDTCTCGAGSLAVRGGALAATNATVDLLGASTISGASASVSGGGIWATSGATVTVAAGVTLSSNTADSGGGLALAASSTATLTGVTVSSNTASGPRGGGGGIAAAHSSTINLGAGTSVSSNSASVGCGGGLALSSGASVDVAASVTTNANSAADGGGGLCLAGTGTSASHSAASWRLEGNMASGPGGGAVLVTSGASWTAAGSVLAGNSVVGASGSGGSLLAVGSGSSASLSGASLVVLSRAAFGGGLAVSAGATLAVSGSARIEGCTASRSGGGLWAGGLGSEHGGESGSGTVTLNGALVTGNVASEYGGGLWLQAVGVASVTGATFHNNSAGSSGGGLGASASSGVAVSGTTLTANVASQRGGAVFALEAEVSVSGGLMRSNSAGVSGGGLAGGSMSVLALTGGVLVSHNRAGQAGGGIAAADGASLRVTGPSGAAIEHNVAVLGGGLYAVRAAAVDLTSASLSHNVASKAGGGAHVSLLESVLVLADTAVVNNTAPWRGGGVFAYGCSVAVSGSAVVSNNGVAQATSLPELVPGDDVHEPESVSGAGLGGGVYCLSDVAELGVPVLGVSGASVVVRENNATFGGGLFADGCALNVSSGATVEDNGATVDGGGLFGRVATVSVSAITCRGNFAGGAGGCLVVDHGTSGSVTSSTLRNNVAVGPGGAVHWRDLAQPLTEAGNTFSGNAAVYGPDHATHVARLQLLSEPPNIPYASGLEVADPWVLGLVDFYGQPAVTANALVTLTVPNAVVRGGVESAVAGVARFGKVAVTAYPGIPQNMTFSIRSLPLVTPALDSIIIRACLPGEFLVGEICLLCETGTYSDVPNAPRCSKCAPRTYAPNQGMAACLPCPPGTFSDVEGRSSCSECDPGRFSKGNVTRCSECPEGTYQPRRGSSSCCLCSSGTWNPRTGQTECEPCKAGTYTFNPLLECVPCDLSSSSCELDLVKANPGFYRFLVEKEQEEVDRLGNSDATVARMLNESVAELCGADVNGTTFQTNQPQFQVVTGAKFDVFFGKCETSLCRGDNECAPHHTGDLCGSCVPGFKLTAGKCVECKEPNVMAILIAGVVLPLAFTWFNFWFASASSGNTKIIVFFGQMFGFLIAAFPRRQAEDANTWTLFSASLDSIPDTCMMPLSIYQMFIIKMFVPVYFVMLLLLVWSFERLLHRCIDLYGEKNPEIAELKWEDEAEERVILLAAKAAMLRIHMRGMEAEDNVMAATSVGTVAGVSMSKHKSKKKKKDHSRKKRKAKRKRKSSSTMSSTSSSSSSSSSIGSSASSSSSSTSSSSMSMSQVRAVAADGVALVAMSEETPVNVGDASTVGRGRQGWSATGTSTASTASSDSRSPCETSSSSSATSGDLFGPQAWRAVVEQQEEEGDDKVGLAESSLAVVMHNPKLREQRLAEVERELASAAVVAKQASVAVSHHGFSPKRMVQAKLGALSINERFRRALLMIVLFTYTPTMNLILAMLRCRAPFPEEEHEQLLVADVTVQCKDKNGAWNPQYFRYRVVAFVLAGLYVYALPVALMLALVVQRIRRRWLPQWAHGMLGMLLFPFERAFFMWSPWLELRKTLVVSVLQLSGEEPDFTRMLLLVLFTFFAILHLMFRPYLDSALDMLETLTLLMLLVTAMLATVAWTQSETALTDSEANQLAFVLEYFPYGIIALCVLYILWSLLHPHLDRNVFGRKLTPNAKREAEREAKLERARHVLHPAHDADDAQGAEDVDDILKALDEVMLHGDGLLDSVDDLAALAVAGAADASASSTRSRSSSGGGGSLTFITASTDDDDDGGDSGVPFASVQPSTDDNGFNGGSSSTDMSSQLDLTGGGQYVV